MRRARPRRLLLALVSSALLLVGGVAAALWWRTPADQHAPGPGGFGVQAAAASTSGFTLSASPANLNVPAGTQGAFTVTVVRTAFSGAIGFTVTGLPAGATATFAPSSTTGNTTTLYVTAPIGPATQGSYNPVITGRSGGVSDSTTVHLVVSAGQARQFSISGSLSSTDALAPGVTRPLNLAIKNPNNQPITVTGVTVTVAQIDTDPAYAQNGLACTASDFATTPFSGSITVPANATRTFSDLLPLNHDAWPQIMMLDRDVNQDACKNAALTLTYSGTAQGH